MKPSNSSSVMDDDDDGIAGDAVASLGDGGDVLRTGIG